MQPKRALLLVACGGLVAALATVAVPVSALPAAAGTDCHAGPGLKVNKWVGQQSSGEIGLWNNDKNWSLGRYPRFTSMHQVACIRTRAHVVMWQGSGLHVHVAAIDMGGTGVLEVRPSNSLFVEANPHEVVSSVAPDARLEVAGAMLGGHGRIDVQGELTLSAGSGKINKLATRPCERDCTTGLRGRFGTISVEPGGLFVVGARARVADSYHVVIIGGEMRVEGDNGQLTADAGTRLGLRSNSAGDRKPALTFRNNGGWYAGPNSARLGRTQVAIHGGVVAKELGSGTSSLQGRVSAQEGLNARVETGTLAVEGSDPVRTDLSGGSAYSTGSCLPAVDAYGCRPVATAVDTQIASVQLPEGAAADQVTVTEGSSKPGTLGRATIFNGSLPQAARGDASLSRADPVVLELRYDAQVVGTYTPASRVAVAESTSDSFRDLPDCSPTGRVPTSDSACVDRGQSHFEADGDLVMVVRTLHFSRYICR